VTSGGSCFRNCLIQMKLDVAMRPIAWERKAAVCDVAAPSTYVVLNPPPGEEAYVMKANGGWRVTREKGSIRTESPNSYISEYEALAALQLQYRWEY
jgi:hypothetical protein